MPACMYRKGRMFMSRSKVTTVAAFALLLMLFTCSTWPTIIATSEAIADLAGVFDPALSEFSVTATKLLMTAESAANAYHSDKNATTAAKYVAAIEDIETQLPADEQVLNAPPAVKLAVGA